MMDDHDHPELNFDPLDDTKVWPEEIFPPKKVGVLQLNRNVENVFAENEQSAFGTGVLVDGLDFSEDKMLVGRTFSYSDTQRYRVGANYLQLPVNSPKCAHIGTNQRDGQMTYFVDTGGENPHVNYEPSTMGGLIEAQCGVEPQISPPRGGPVIAGVDGSAASHAALLLAADLAASLGARLVLVHAWSDVSEDEHGLHRRSEDLLELAAQGRALVDEETRQVTELHRGLAVADELVHDTAVRALLARADGAQMIVVGHRGEPLARAKGLGSTSRALIGFAPCPVVVSPPVPAARTGISRHGGRRRLGEPRAVHPGTPPEYCLPPQPVQ